MVWGFVVVLLNDLFLFYVHWCFACMHVCVSVSDSPPPPLELYRESCELPCGC